MQVVNPLGTPQAAGAELAASPQSLRGARLGVLWNGKPNADELLRAVAARLIEGQGMAGMLWLKKGDLASGPGFPSPQPLIDRLSSGTVAVLAASGD